MAKTVNDQQLTIIIRLTKEAGQPIQVSCRGDYEVSSDDLVVNRSKEITLTASVKNELKNFGINVVLADIKSTEEG